MDLFVRIAALLLVTSVLCLFLGHGGKNFAILVGLAACCIAGIALVSYIKPIISFLDDVEAICGLNNECFQILLKAVGVTVLTEVTGTICIDAGNGSLAKMIQMLSSGAILCLSLPILETLVDVLREIVSKL